MVGSQLYAATAFLLVLTLAFIIGLLCTEKHKTALMAHSKWIIQVFWCIFVRIQLIEMVCIILVLTHPFLNIVWGKISSYYLLLFLRLHCCWQPVLYILRSHIRWVPWQIQVDIYIYSRYLHTVKEICSRLLGLNFCFKLIPSHMKVSTTNSTTKKSQVHYLQPEMVLISVGSVTQPLCHLLVL